MVYAAWILFLGLLTVFFNNYLAKQNNPNTNVQGQTTSNQSIEVVLQRNRYGHYVTNGKINGSPVTFLLDTGATTISVPKKDSSSVEFKKGRAAISTHGERNGYGLPHKTRQCWYRPHRTAPSTRRY